MENTKFLHETLCETVSISYAILRIASVHDPFCGLKNVQVESTLLQMTTIMGILFLNQTIKIVLVHVFLMLLIFMC